MVSAGNYTFGSEREAGGKEHTQNRRGGTPSGAATSQNIDRENRIQRSRPESCSIERYILISNVLERRSNGVEHLHIQSAGQLIASDFNARQFTVVANPELAEAQLPHAFLGVLHLLQHFARHLAAILHA